MIKLNCVQCVVHFQKLLTKFFNLLYFQKEIRLNDKQKDYQNTSQSLYTFYIANFSEDLKILTKNSD